MDADLYKAAIDYERLTRSIYQEILNREGQSTIKVEHDVSLRGRSGVEHQIDVCWELKQAGIKQRVLIECKNYSSNLTLEKARNFFAVTHDVGNCVGVMVTRVGYQSGAAEFCKHYGISLKLLRSPTDEDWKGRIKGVHINLHPRVPVSSEEKPIVCELYLRPRDDLQEKLLHAAASQNPNLVRASPDLQFLNSSGEPATEELRWWLPRQLDVLAHEDGGPYVQKIRLDDHFVLVDLGRGHELVQVIGLNVTFHVETLDSESVVYDAAQTVSAILKDFESGDWEHVQRDS